LEQDHTLLLLLWCLAFRCPRPMDSRPRPSPFHRTTNCLKNWTHKKWHCSTPFLMTRKHTGLLMNVPRLDALWFPS